MRECAGLRSLEKRGSRRALARRQLHCRLVRLRFSLIPVDLSDRSEGAAPTALGSVSFCTQASRPGLYLAGRPSGPRERMPRNRG